MTASILPAAPSPAAAAPSELPVRPMRILLAAQWYAPVIGGEENHVRALGAALAARGHAVSVVTLAQDGAPARERDGEVEVHRVRAGVQRLPFLFGAGARQSAPPIADPVAVRAISRIARDAGAEVIHAHNWLVHSALPATRGAGAPPLVLTLHDYSRVCARKSLVYMGRTACPGPAPARCLRCAADHYGFAKGTITLGALAAGAPFEARGVDHFLAVSGAVAEGNRLAAAGLPHEVIPNFIADTLPAAAPDDAARLALLPLTPYLLYVGSLARIKGIGVLLRAYALLRAALGAAAPPLVLVGYRGREDLSAYGDLFAGVTLLENWPRGAVLEAFRRSLLAVVPSTWGEPCPTVAMEAMTAGVPVVASRIGGLPEIVDDGETGLLVPPGDHGALAEALAELVGDGARRAALGEAGRTRVARFRAAAVVPRIEAVYARLLEGRR